VILVVTTCNVGQLKIHVNTSHWVLDFTNDQFALFMIWVAIVIEFSRLMHSTYLVQILVAALAREKVELYLGFLVLLRTENAPRSFTKLLKKIPVVAKYISYVAAGMEVGTNA